MAETKRHRRRPAPAEISPSEADRDILDQYFAEVSRYPLLNAEEEKALARRVQSGDHDAMEELVRRNLRFVVSVAKKYQNRGLPLIDLIGEGNVGLMTGSEVHLLRGVVDPAGHPRVARAAGAHGARSAQPHGRSLTSNSCHGAPARQVRPGADPG